MSEQRKKTQGDASLPVESSSPIDSAPSPEESSVKLELSRADAIFIRDLLRRSWQSEQRHYTLFVAEANQSPSRLSIAAVDTQHQVVLEVARIGNLVASAITKKQSTAKASS